MAKLRNQLPPQKCAYCKKTFIPTRRKTMYCCGAHSVAAFRARRAEEKRAEEERKNNPQLALMFTIENNEFTDADMRMLRGGK